ncbi:MAG: hypothetical protein IT427_03270 [Pirellulales bacterium]|nr:hypothetical protein [Pirellulales bacterium]
MRVPDDEIILSAVAFRLREQQENLVDGESRVDLSEFIKGKELNWNAPGPEWLVVVIVSQAHDLNYLGSAVLRRWNEIFYDRYKQELGDRLGKSLVAYGPDERLVLGGNILYSDALRDRFKREKGFDPLPELAALFIDIGSQTPSIRCQYYDVMNTLLEENLYKPTTQWLHDHRMRHVTIATWGRQDLLGQTTNYGDFFRLMKHFDMPGNEDSDGFATGAGSEAKLNGSTGAFIDTKLSSSMAHINGRNRIAVCAYWGAGWGFTQEQNIARTNVNYALGVNLYNTHGVLYSLLAGRNEFVPPEVHFYQPYWQTWRTFTDYVSRLSYVLSHGHHRADVALLYPLSTIHEHWHSGSNFEQPAKDAQESMFALAKALYSSALDFDFVDESHISQADVRSGKLKFSNLEFPVIVLPAISTLRIDVLTRLQEFVSAGGTLVVFRQPAASSAEQGRDDPQMQEIWRSLLGNYEQNNQPVLERNHASGGRTILVRSKEMDVPGAIRAAITPDVALGAADLSHTHQQVNDRHIYFLVNRLGERREVCVTLGQRGTPEIWDARTGEVRPLHRYRIGAKQTHLRLTMDPYEGIVVVLQPITDKPQILNDNFASIDDIRKIQDGFEVTGTIDSAEKPSVQLAIGGRMYSGQSTVVPSLPSIALDGLWQCEYRLTMDNRWGDFRYPPTNKWIGPESPRMKYREEPVTPSRPDWQRVNYDDSDWRLVSYSFGPYWQLLEPLGAEVDSAELQDKIVLGKVDFANPEVFASKSFAWRPYVYSWKFGSDRDEVHQFASDGLGPVSPDFMVFDPAQGSQPAVRYLATRIFVPSPTKMYLNFGGESETMHRQAWVNGQRVVNVDEGVKQPIGEAFLLQGWNRVALRLVQPRGKRVTTFAVFTSEPHTPQQPRFMPLSRWYEGSRNLVYDYRTKDDKLVGWFRFPAPPGAQSARLNLDAESVEAWIDGNSVTVDDGVIQFSKPAEGKSQVVQVALRVQHKPGHYEGAAFCAPVEFICGRGQIPLGDWSGYGLEYYSGGVKYIRHITLTKEQLGQRVTLDLGDVRTSAEVTVNGRPVGVRLARPFTFDLTDFGRVGDNVIEVEVLNTLANYMSQSPSRYVYEKQTVSGLLGPTLIRFAPRINVICQPKMNAE